MGFNAAVNHLADRRRVYEGIGGRPTIERVHKIFYDKLYEHPWLGKFFEGIDQTLIENQQTDFMSQPLGGPQVYAGKFPGPGHKHMMITKEIFDVRHKILKESLFEAGVPADLAAIWLDVDAAFANAIVKKDIGQCKQRYRSEGIIVVPRPPSY